MIEFRTGNLLHADAEALVNTVNCVGVMGKGIALQFKQAYPENFREYVKACKQELVQPGRMFVVPTNGFGNPRFIINFPTKRHWKGKAKLADIESGLEALAVEIRARNIRSIAVPPLGCGNGGLSWDAVLPRIRKAFAELPNVQAFVFAPSMSPAGEQMPVGTTKPKLTRARAIVLALLQDYLAPGYKLSKLEVQKLAYFVQVAGEPLRLQFVKHKFGPYAEKLNHVLQRLEGHFIRGYGDRSRNATMCLLPGAVEEAEALLDHDSAAKQRLERVAHLIEGYETPCGMELLATVHWVMHESLFAAQDPNAAVEQVFAWPGKKARLSEEHIRKAWDRLRACEKLKTHEFHLLLDEV